MEHKTIRVADRFLSYKHKDSGKFCFITRDRRLINEVTDRDNVLLKIFFNPLGEEGLERYLWGRHFEIELDDGTVRWEASMLLEASKIQNLCAWSKLAPRVYQVGTIEFGSKSFPYQLVEDCGEAIETIIEKRAEVFGGIHAVGDHYGFHAAFDDLGIAENIIGGKLVDFQGYRFDADYVQKMAFRYKSGAMWNGNTYQAYKNIGGYRSDFRKSILEKAESEGKLDLLGQNVLDIGCSGGEFSRFAVDKGAWKVTAIDLRGVVDVAMEVANYEGYFDIDWIEKEFERNEDFDFDCDVVFFLSMKRHIGLPSVLFETRVVVYEHNGDEPAEEVLARFEAKGYRVEDLGETGKNDNRHLYIFTRI